MRRTKPEKREVTPDLRYNSMTVSYLVNRIMKNGKKSAAVRMMYDAMDILHEKTGKDALEVLETALKNVGPLMEVKPRRVGGATYQVPVEVGGERQLALALLVSRDGGMPLGSYLYHGNRNDVTVFAEAFSALREQLSSMAVEIESVTFVYDKGNVSLNNQLRMENVEYVTALVPGHHKELMRLDEADAEQLEDGTAVWRMRQPIWGRQQTVVMLVSETLRRGQLLGFDQHLGKALLALERIRKGLLSAKRRRKRETVAKAVAKICQAGQLKNALLAEIIERESGFFDLRYHVDMQRYEELCTHYFGRRLLVTNRDAWTTEEIVAAYRGQSHVEAAFRTVKDPFHLAVRPQYHWTDQKIRVHVFYCLMAYLMVSLMIREIRKIGLKHSPRQMLDLLEEVRLATYVEAPDKPRPGRPAIRTQMETCNPAAKQLFDLFVSETTNH